MNILLCHGRLDIPFKQLVDIVPPMNYSNLQPIRKHWHNFYECTKLIPEVEEVIMPMWQLTPDFYRSVHSKYDRILVPHRQKFQFRDELEDEILDKMVFFMQTVRPEYFTLDRNGWGANLEFLPVSNDPILDNEYTSGQNNDFVKAKIFIDDWKRDFMKNISKFPQPENARMGFRRYDILFVCQIPHDETIRYHSDTSVENALIDVLEQASRNGWSVLVKGHPVNPGSMEKLKIITRDYSNVGTKCNFDSNISILEAIQACKVVAMVNSGVGFEAMLMGKPVYSYGRSEYQNVVNFKEPIDIDNHSVVDYSSFLYRFFEHTLNTKNPEKFTKKMVDILQ